MLQQRWRTTSEHAQADGWAKKEHMHTQDQGTLRQELPANNKPLWDSRRKKENQSTKVSGRKDQLKKRRKTAMRTHCLNHCSFLARDRG